MDRRDLLRVVAGAIATGALPMPAYVPSEHAVPPCDEPLVLWARASDPLADFNDCVRRVEQQSSRSVTMDAYLNRAHRAYILEHWNLDIADAAVRESLCGELGARLHYVE